VRHGTVEKISPEVSLAGFACLSTKTADTAVSGAPLKKPISNFYQTDPVSRASVTMAQCTRAFVSGEDFGFSGSEEAPRAGYA